MIRIAVCDDIDIERDIATKSIMDYCAKNNLIAEFFQFSSGEDMIETFEEGKYSIIILDIKMKNLNGIEAASFVRSKDRYVEIIFTTTSRDFAVESYGDIRAIDYVIKPYTDERIYRAFKNCKNLDTSLLSYIEVLSDNTRKQIECATIKYIEVLGKIATIHTAKGDIKTYTALDELIKLFHSSNFYRCHRSFIINFDYIKKNFNDYVIMSNDTQISIARSNIIDFKKTYTEYLFTKARRA